MNARPILSAAFHAMSQAECERDLYFGQTTAPRQPYLNDLNRTFYLHTEILGAKATIVAEVTIYDRTDYAIDRAWLLDVGGVECSTEPNEIPLDAQKVERECGAELMDLVSEAWQS